MSQRQKDQRAEDGLPPAGPNGELKFQPETLKAEAKGKRSEMSDTCLYISVVLVFIE